jgi:hypothetical protein
MDTLADTEKIRLHSGMLPLRLMAKMTPRLKELLKVYFGFFQLCFLICHYKNERYLNNGS